MVVHLSCSGYKKTSFPGQMQLGLLSYRENYRKVPNLSDARTFCCNLPKIKTKRPNLRVFCQKDANGIANSVDPDQTVPLGAV